MARFKLLILIEIQFVRWLSMRTFGFGGRFLFALTPAMGHTIVFYLSSRWP